jgi:hypothetical protein
MTTETVGRHQLPAEQPPEAALAAVADGLTAAGFDISIPGEEQACHLHLTNVRGALCDLALTNRGAMIWTYRPFRGTWTSPAQIAATALGVLGAEAAPDHGMSIRHYPGLTLKGLVGRALAERGMTVDVKVIYQDDVNYEIHAEIEATNPAWPGRGFVRVSDDATIRWGCQLTSATSGEGLGLDVIVQTIATALAGQNT